MNPFLAVFIGGGLGSVLRFGIGKVLAKTAGEFPVGTLAANVLATLILALTVAYLTSKDSVPSWVSLFIVTGFCGGFSTFSTFSYDTVKLFQDGNPGLAVTNVLVSILFCVFVAWVVLRK